ncbi:hypothetical protein Ancab_023168 [Ancistrocladus abbreviatus]
MALKFLNKKGWHTGSLRNIENVWKAEQKHEAEQKKLEELRKQIQEERERSEFRQLQEQAGLVPTQERLEFLYDSGLAVGKGNSDGFKALETYPRPADEMAGSSSSMAAVPGALFEEKPQSANDAWRKLHSDPLLMIRQREQEALARIKNNPIKMAMIRKSVESKKHEDATDHEGHKKLRSKHRKHSLSKNHSDSDDDKIERQNGTKKIKHRKSKHGDDFDERKSHRHGDSYSESKRAKQLEGCPQEPLTKKRYYERSKDGKDELGGRTDKSDQRGRDNDNFRRASDSDCSGPANRNESNHRRRCVGPKLSEEERAARLREMQLDAQLHEEQRWKRLKKADEDDVMEAKSAGATVGRSFLDDAQKSVYGAEKGGRSSIAESVRRRTHYLQDRSETDQSNAFRR